MSENLPAPPSKTRIKKEMNALQQMGLRLTAFNRDTLENAGLPPGIIAAVQDYRKISANSALKRQAQYIGRLMRELSDEEVAQIAGYLARLDGSNAAHNAAMQRLEIWRERLIADDAALTEYLESYPAADANALRVQIRNARREKEQEKPPKAYRALFRLLKADADI